MKELVQLKFSKIMQTPTYTVVVLGTEKKRFSIYMEPAVGKLLQLALTGVEKPRPLTHDLFTTLLHGLEAHIKQIVINELQDTVYFCRLYVEHERNDLKHIVEVDARPSDCIALAVLNEIPLYCTQEVLNQTIPFEE